MQASSRFSLTDSVAAFVLVVVLACTLQSIVGCGAMNSARKTARQMQNSTHVRGIHSGCALAAMNNKDFYPGLDGNGKEKTGPLPKPGEGDTKLQFTTAAAGGYDPAYRIGLLLGGTYFSPEYMISPSEDKAVKTLVQTGGSVSSANFSYAMLRINDAAAAGRRGEWRATNNSRAAVITDRNLGTGGGVGASSVHEKNKWVGSVCYNDNHVNFEVTSMVQTNYNFKDVTADDLFADNRDRDGNPGNDAAMVYQDATSYVNQR